MRVLRIRTIGLLGALLLLGPASASAADEPGRASVPEDLFAVITLRGKPCGRVKSYERRGDDDYLVTCESGHRYRVYVNEQQRVVVEER
jgi:hypothetical protein